MRRVQITKVYIVEVKDDDAKIDGIFVSHNIGSARVLTIDPSHYLTHDSYRVDATVINEYTDSVELIQDAEDDC